MRFTKKFGLFKETSTGFLEDLPDERKACAKSILQHVNQEEIKEIWGVSVQNSQKFKHFILLMKNSAHLCSCLATVTRGIVCRHYFSLMMCTHAAAFHIQLIRKRWYKNPELNGRNEPFVYAAKFQDMELLKQPENQEISYLTAMIQNNVDQWNQESKTNLDERIFYGKVMGLAKKVTLKAVGKRDMRILEIFQQYLNEFDDENSNLENDFDDEIENDELEENDDLQLQNPIKKPKKGRPRGTKRIKSSSEIPSSSKRHCKICKEVGHYSNTCMQNPNRKG